MDQKCIFPIAGPRVREDDVSQGVQNALGGAIVDEEGVLRSWLASVGFPLQRGDASPQSGPEDLEELLSSALTTKLGY